MTFLIDILVKRACKLLHRVDQNLLAFAVHLEALGKRICLSLDQTLARQDHEALNLMGVDIYLTSGLIVRLKNAFILLRGSLVGKLSLHDAL